MLYPTYYVARSTAADTRTYTHTLYFINDSNKTHQWWRWWRRRWQKKDHLNVSQCMRAHHIYVVCLYVLVVCSFLPSRATRVRRCKGICWFHSIYHLLNEEYEFTEETESLFVLVHCIHICVNPPAPALMRRFYFVYLLFILFLIVIVEPGRNNKCGDEGFFWHFHRLSRAWEMLSWVFMIEPVAFRSK